jgi:8-oxo-dGTP diphosphatase
MPTRPIVVLTALNLEYRAVREHLTEVRKRTHAAGTVFEVGRLGSSDCQIALAVVGKGNHPSAVLTERAVTEFDPPAIIFTGVAGALKTKVGLGDIVVADHVYAYHGATSRGDGSQARPRVWETPHEILQLAQHLEPADSWARRLPAGTPEPVVWFGPIAAGEVVHDSAVSELARWLREHYTDALAIEMEAAGVFQAAHLNGSIPVAVVRGISDRADGTKAATDGANWQPRAAAHAAAFALALAEQFAGSAPSKPAPASGGVTNIASGNANVGVQAGTIHGGITFGPRGRA